VRRPPGNSLAGVEASLNPSARAIPAHLTTGQYARLVGEWVERIDLQRPAYGTQSLRRTKAALVYKQTGNLRARQILLGHGKLESTLRNLGSGLTDHSQKMPAAVRAMADMKVCAHRS
jgi:hypothetical protein